jgi:hypothetical protein
MKRGEAKIFAVCDVDEQRLTNASRTAKSDADRNRDFRYVEGILQWKN